MYHRVENLVIPPHTRQGYQPTQDQPKHVIFGHSRKWPRILREMEGADLKQLKVIDHVKTSTEDEVPFSFGGVNMKYVYTPEGALALHTQIVQNAMKGSRNFINIGCVGSLDENIERGGQIIGQKAIRDSGFGKQLATQNEPAETSKELTALMADVSDKLARISVLSNVWCVQSLYYTNRQLNKAINHPLKPKAVEMEMEAGCITADWLNHNYFNDQPVQYAHLGYVSDIVRANSTQTWQDPFVAQDHTTERLVPWKKNSFRIAVETLANIS